MTGEERILGIRDKRAVHLVERLIEQRDLDPDQMGEKRSRKKNEKNKRRKIRRRNAKRSKRNEREKRPKNEDAETDETGKWKRRWEQR